MGRGKPASKPDEAERRCIVTRDVGGKSGLIRFVVGPDAVLVPDVLQKLPGRGLWVSANTVILRRAVADNHFAKAARQKVHVPDDLPEVVETALATRLIGLIALARKAGDAVTGYEKVKGWLESGAAAVLIQARDGSERGKSKLRAPRQTGHLVDVLTANELGAAFGRENVIHGALAAGGLTNRVVEEASRLAGLRPTDTGVVAPGKDSKA